MVKQTNKEHKGFLAIWLAFGIIAILGIFILNKTPTILDDTQVVISGATYYVFLSLALRFRILK